MHIADAFSLVLLIGGSNGNSVRGLANDIFDILWRAISEA